MLTRQKHDIFFQVNQARASYRILGNESIDIVDQYDHLGVTPTNKFSWLPHILKIHLKASKKLNLLKPIKFKLGKDPLKFYINPLSVLAWNMRMLCGMGVAMLTVTLLKACNLRQPGS